MTNKDIIKKFTNLIMRDGKKSIASKLLNSGIKKACKELKLTEDQLLNKCLDNIKPLIDARSKKVGNKSYIIPYAITNDQSICLAIKIIIKAVNNRKENNFIDRFANELIDAYNNKGASIKKRNYIHKSAEINKSFASFR